jgi:hypothetical protein
VNRRLLQQDILGEAVISLGLVGLVLKPDFDPHLVPAIRAVHQKETYFSPGHKAM